MFLIFLLMCKPTFGEPAFSCDFGRAMFVQLTCWSSHIQSCRTHPTIGTTPWFSYLYTKHKSHLFCQQHTLSVIPSCTTGMYLPVSPTMQPPPTIICNTLWFSSLEVWRQISCFWQVYILFKSGRFSPSTHPSHPRVALNVCCFCHVSCLFMLWVTK